MRKRKGEASGGPAPVKVDRILVATLRDGVRGSELFSLSLRSMARPYGTRWHGSGLFFNPALFRYDRLNFER